VTLPFSTSLKFISEGVSTKPSASPNTYKTQRMDGRDWQLDDLLGNDHFREWVRDPESPSRLYWEEWVKQHPDREDLLQEARLIIGSLPPDKHLTDPEVEESWLRFQSRRQVTASPTPRRPGRIPPYWYQVAASFLLAGLLGMAAWWFNGPKNQQVIAAAGEKRAITLPDGSTALLNAHAQLRYRGDWGEEADREVWLEGEAYFEVAKKPFRPAGSDKTGYAKFIVRTKELAVEVIGTQFNVNTRAGNTRVILREGKVKLDAAGAPPLLMQPGEWVEYNGREKEMVKKAVNPDLYTAWRQNQLRFNETPLREVAQLLKDNYGLTVQFKSPDIEGKKLSGVMPADDLPLLLRAIERSFALKVEQQGNSVVVRARTP
jgi:ferric-dicitrate binding protein FerR (iron transport regulator)